MRAPHAVADEAKLAIVFTYEASQIETLSQLSLGAVGTARPILFNRFLLVLII